MVGKSFREIKMSDKQSYYQKTKEIREYLKSQGICIQCRKNKTDGLTKCDKCRNRTKTIDKEYKAKGICVQCHARKATEGFAWLAQEK